MDSPHKNGISALVETLKQLRVEEQPRSDGLRLAWRDVGVLWTVNWAEALGRDVANADAALTRAVSIGANDDGAAEIENALWRIGAAFEKLHDVIALGLGVPALKLNTNRRGIRRFESDRDENRKRLRELEAVHSAAANVLRLDEQINNHRFLALRHQMTHSLAPLLTWQSLCWFEVGEIDDRGGVIGYSSGWLRKQLEEASPDLLRVMVKDFAEALMSADADAVCGGWGRIQPRSTGGTAVKRKLHTEQVAAPEASAQLALPDEVVVSLAEIAGVAKEGLLAKALAGRHIAGVVYLHRCRRDALPEPMEVVPGAALPLRRCVVRGINSTPDSSRSCLANRSVERRISLLDRPSRWQA